MHEICKSKGRKHFCSNTMKGKKVNIILSVKLLFALIGCAIISQSYAATSSIVKLKNIGIQPTGGVHKQVPVPATIFTTESYNRLFILDVPTIDVRLPLLLTEENEENDELTAARKQLSNANHACTLLLKESFSGFINPIQNSRFSGNSHLYNQVPCYITFQVFRI